MSTTNRQNCFRVYKDFDDAQIDALEILLTRLYGKFGIHDDTDYSKLTAGDYPVMADLYEIVESEYMKYEKGTKSLFTEELLRKLCLGLNSMCVGAESKFFNGHTNISDDRFICFGVKGLMEANKKLKDAMLFNILSFMNHKLLTKGNTAAFGSGDITVLDDPAFRPMSAYHTVLECRRRCPSD